MNIQQAIARIVGGQQGQGGADLTQEQARQVMEQIMSGYANAAQVGAYLVALRMKGETVDEIAGSAQAMRDQVLAIPVAGAVMDTCGTGGDAAGTFNISTTTAFVVAAQGVTVAKHGNRSVSSKSGSADVLRELGVQVDAEPAVVQRCLAEVGIGFLFAPRHHRAMRHVAGPRQELAIRTIFNLLGPLTNPAGATMQLVGVYSPALVEPLAQVLGRLGARRAMVVHGADGLDEMTTTAATHVAEWMAHGATGRVVLSTLDPEQFGLQRATLADLQGGDAAANAAITRRVLDGEKGPYRDIVLLNAGAALSLTPACLEPVMETSEAQVDRIRLGVQLAAEAIDSGKARQCLEQLIVVSNQA